MILGASFGARVCVRTLQSCRLVPSLLVCPCAMAAAQLPPPPHSHAWHTRNAQCTLRHVQCYVDALIQSVACHRATYRYPTGRLPPPTSFFLPSPSCSPTHAPAHLGSSVRVISYPSVCVPAWRRDDWPCPDVGSIGRWVFVCHRHMRPSWQACLKEKHPSEVFHHWCSMSQGCMFTLPRPCCIRSGGTAHNLLLHLLHNTAWVQSHVWKPGHPRCSAFVRQGRLEALCHT